MKRIFLLIIAAALMSSCIAVKNNGNENKAVKTFNISSNQWVEGDGYYFYHESWSKLHRDILDGATVIATMRNGDVYQMLPFSYFESDGQNYWQREISFDYEPGGITFYYADSEFFFDRRPERLEIQVVVMW